MTKHWYEDEKKVIELAEFLVQSVEIENTEELLEYFKRPDRYTEAWNIYEKEMLGTTKTSQELPKKGQSHEYRENRIKTVLPVPCSCGIA